MKKIFALFFLIVMLAETDSVNVPACVQAAWNNFALIKKNVNSDLGCPRGHHVCQQNNSYMCESCGNDAYQPDFNYPGDYCRQRTTCEARYNMEKKFPGNTSHDAICRCKTGYKQYSNYVCIFHACPRGTGIDDNGQCVVQGDKHPSTSDYLTDVTTQSIFSKDGIETGSIRKEPGLSVDSSMPVASSTHVKSEGAYLLTEIILPVGIVVFMGTIFLSAFGYYKKNKGNVCIQNQIPQNAPSLVHAAGRRVVTRKEASEIGEILGASWVLLAYRFGYSIAEVEKFQLTNQFSISVQSVTMLQNWLEGEKEKATVEILVNELRQLDIDQGKIRDIFPEYYDGAGFVRVVKQS